MNGSAVNGGVANDALAVTELPDAREPVLSVLVQIRPDVSGSGPNRKIFIRLPHGLHLLRHFRFWQ